MIEQIILADCLIEITRKNIKHVHLGVYPPNGSVRISAPLCTDLNKIRVFAISKLSWIKKQQQKIQQQKREFPREYLERESHYLWGKRYLLKIIEEHSPTKIIQKHSCLVMFVRPNTTQEQRANILSSWYREQLKAELPELIEKWAPILNIEVNKFYIQQMKTRWGSCNPQKQNIRLNTELAKKPLICLEYIVVHEMLHLIEPSHNTKFMTLMKQFMPKWHQVKEELNHLPVRHENWTY